MATTPDTSAEHIGFRCVMDPPQPDAKPDAIPDGDPEE